MKYHNTKNWLEPLIKFHRADTFRKLFFFILFVGLYTFGITYLETHFNTLVSSDFIKNIPIMHSLLGFAISMLLVFRTNTAYDRWWEGRKLWGQLVNNCRNLAIKLDTYLPVQDKNERLFFKLLLQHFPENMKSHLQKEKTKFALDSLPHPEIPDFDVSKHVPAQMVSQLQKKIHALYKNQKLDGHQLWLLNGECNSLLDITGSCERIKNTPIPYSYSSFIKKFIVIYVLTLPFGFVFTLGYITIPVVMFVFYVLASLEIIAEEIEEPFGTDFNDLPMQRLSEMIKSNIEEIFEMEKINSHNSQ